MTTQRFVQDAGSCKAPNFKLLFVVLHPGLFCERREERRPIMKQETQTDLKGGE